MIGGGTGGSALPLESQLPTLLADVDLDADLPTLSGRDGHRSARLLLRLHGRPVTEVLVDLSAGGLSADELADRLDATLDRDLIDARLRAAGRPAAGRLTSHGLSATAPAGQRPEPGTSATVVVATRDRTDSLLRTLRSLGALTHGHFDVIVVDSAPRDGATERALADRQWPFAVRYLRSARPGLAVAHNLALPHVTGEVVAFTDDDVEVDPGWLSALCTPFADGGVACVTGLILPADLETPAQLLVERAGGFGRGFVPRRFRLGDRDQGVLFPFAAGRYGSGANMAFRTGWLRDAGGFDPALGAGTRARGGDDLLGFVRVVLDGRTLAYEPSAVVRHWHRRDDASMRRQAFGYGVGLGAYFAAIVRERPGTLVTMLRRSLPALRHMLSPSSEKNRYRGSGFPRSLVWREAAGLVLGPLLYVLSRRTAKRS